MPYLLSEDFIKNRIPKLMAGKAERWFRDSKLTNYAVRVRANKSGLVRDGYLWPKGSPKILVGSWPTFNAESLRAEAAMMLQAMQRGDDPKAERAAKKTAPLFEDLVDVFRREHLAGKEPATRKDYEGRIRRILLPTLKGRRVADIDIDDISKMKRKFAAKPTDLNRGLAVLSVMMGVATVEKMRRDNPVKGLKRYRETKRSQWLDHDDLPKFLAELATVEGAVGDLLRFLAVGGWRVSKARLLRWDQVNLAKLTVDLGETATKKTATTLSADAATLIDRQQHRTGYVFSDRGGAYPVSYTRLCATLTDVCEAAGIARITPHAFRHTGATHSAIAGASVPELMQAFGWNSAAMVKIYVERAEGLARKGVERTAGAINVFGKPAAQISKIER